MPGTSPGMTRERHAGSLPQRVCVRPMAGCPRRGWRAERRKPMVSHSGGVRGRPPARHMRSSSKALAHAIWRRLSVRRPRFRCTLPRCPAWTKSTGQTAFGIGRRVVSQLLAGPRNGPGGSPTPPRVTCMRSKPRGDTAPHPASRRLMMRPLRGRGESSVSEVWRAGIKGACGVCLVPETDTKRACGLGRERPRCPRRLSQIKADP